MVTKNKHIAIIFWLGLGNKTTWSGLGKDIFYVRSVNQMYYICLLRDINLKQSPVTFCFTHDTNQVVSSLTKQSTSTSALTCVGFPNIF